MSARKSSHRTIFLIVSSGSPLALIASSLRSISKKPVCPMTRSFHPPMVHCNQRVRFAATWREEFFEVPSSQRRRVMLEYILVIGLLALAAYTEYDKWTRRCGPATEGHRVGDNAPC